MAASGAGKQKRSEDHSCAAGLRLRGLELGTNIAFKFCCLLSPGKRTSLSFCRLLDLEGCFLR